MGRTVSVPKGPSKKMKTLHKHFMEAAFVSWRGQYENFIRTLAIYCLGRLWV